AVAAGGIATNGAVGQGGRAVISGVKVETASEQAAAIAPGGIAGDLGVGRRGLPAAGEHAAASALGGVAADRAVGQDVVAVNKAGIATATDSPGPGEHAAANAVGCGVAADGAVVQSDHVGHAIGRGQRSATQDAAAAAARVAADNTVIQRGRAIVRQ